MKTTQAIRNIRKYKRRIEVAPKGRMVTDDYGNKLSVKKKSDGTFGRRHTLNRAKKKVEKLKKDNSKIHNMLKNDITYDTSRSSKEKKDAFKTRTLLRHSASVSNRNKTSSMFSDPKITNKHNRKSDYHAARSTKDNKAATHLAKILQPLKRKPKDFTK